MNQGMGYKTHIIHGRIEQHKKMGRSRQPQDEEQVHTFNIILLKEQYINFRHPLPGFLGRTERATTLHAEAALSIGCKYCLWLSSVLANEWFEVGKPGKKQKRWAQQVDPPLFSVSHMY